MVHPHAVAVLFVRKYGFEATFTPHVAQQDKALFRRKLKPPGCCLCLCYRRWWGTLGFSCAGSPGPKRFACTVWRLPYVVGRESLVYLRKKNKEKENVPLLVRSPLSLRALSASWWSSRLHECCPLLCTRPWLALTLLLFLGVSTRVRRVFAPPCPGRRE